MSELVEYVMECNITQNDATIYLWLLENKISNPSEISKGTGIQRPRVYDSLKRLIERGLALQEVGKKRPQYTISDSRVLLTKLQNQIDSKIEARDALKEKIIERRPSPMVKGIFFFTDEKVLRLKIQKQMEQSQNKITIMAVFPFSIEKEAILSPQVLGKKGLEGQEITLLLNINPKNWESCVDLFGKNVKIYHYPRLKEISTIIHLIDDETLFISSFKKRKKKISLDLGMFFNGDYNFTVALDFLIQGFIQQSISLKERLKELKKSIVYPTDRLKTLLGIDE